MADSAIRSRRPHSLFLPLQIQSAEGENGSSGARQRRRRVLRLAAYGGDWRWRCWPYMGDCEHLQLGHGDRKGNTTASERPVRRCASSGYGSHHCAAIGGGRVYTWGSGSRSIRSWERRSEAVPRLVVAAHIEAVRVVAVGIPVCLVRMASSIRGNGKTASLVMSQGRSPTPACTRWAMHELGIACDDRTLASMMAGMYTWGAGGHGELGHGNL